MNDLVIFTGNSNPDLAQKICEYLDLPLGGAKVKTFSDGEIQIEIDENVRPKDVFVIQSTCSPGQRQSGRIAVDDRCLQTVFGPTNHGRHSVLRVCPPG